ncbi:ABC transporter permease [Gordonia sp. DT30]|uniref:ABC transporter permease n=1 Tax=unclassified Gordonia (in: high G+C Gram-positive bacteria) TaxID=2657482 RepID=UPI003CE68A6D
MVRYLATRIAAAIGVLWAAFTVAFIILILLPSDPVTIATSGDASTPVDPAAVAALKARYGLDRSIWEQYWSALTGALHGDFGISISQGRPVTDVIFDALPSTVALTLTAVALAVVLGVGLAVLATWTRFSALRRILLSIPSLVVALPTFWVGLVLLQVFAFRLAWFPAFGDTRPGSLVLPAVTLAIPYAGVLGQVLVTSMTATDAQPFVQTATAKGASRGRVIARHILRVSSLPALTVAGVIVGNLLGGAVVVETVFSRPGVGQLAQSAVLAQDIPVVLALVTFSALVFVCINLAVDVVYPFLDPRILTGRSRDGRSANGPANGRADTDDTATELTNV